MKNSAITIEKVLERMKQNELKEIIREKVLNMGFSEKEVERYFADSETINEFAKIYS